MLSILQFRSWQVRIWFMNLLHKWTKQAEPIWNVLVVSKGYFFFRHLKLLSLKLFGSCLCQSRDCFLVPVYGLWTYVRCMRTDLFYLWFSQLSKRPTGVPSFPGQTLVHGSPCPGVFQRLNFPQLLHIQNPITVKMPVSTKWLSTKTKG